MNDKARVVKLAKQLYGRNAIIEERPKALDAAGRESANERRKVRQARLAELEPICKGEFVARQTLLTAVQFVCDVDGDDPSIPQLKTANTAYRIIVDAIAVRRELQEEGRKVNTYTKRCNVSRVLTDAPLPMLTTVADGDTWDEVLTKLQTIANNKMALA